MFYKGALCLQGGAMRGVFTSGVLDAFMDNDIEISDCFGISAGSKNMQYYPTHQKGMALKCDIECVTNKRCIQLANRFIKGRGGVIDKKYYIEEVRNKMFPVDFEKMKTSKIQLHIGCTNCSTGELEYFLKDDPDFDRAVCASCSMPLIQEKVEIRGNEYLDGGVAESIPFKSVMNLGFEKLIIVETRQKGFQNGETSEFEKVTSKLMYSKDKEFLEKFLSSNKRQNELFKEIAKFEKENKVVVIRPSKDLNLKMLERDVDKINSAYEDGYTQGKLAIDKIKKYFES